MPQGKGTYGSKVGRPPKKGKKKYYGGGSVDPFSAKNPEGVMVKKEMEAIDEANMQKDIQDSIPIANAQERSQESPMGEEGGTGRYKEGGKRDEWKVKGYEYHTKMIKDEILDKEKNIYDRNVTDLVKLRSRRQEEIKKSKKSKK